MKKMKHYIKPGLATIKLRTVPLLNPDSEEGNADPNPARQNGMDDTDDY